MHAVTLAVLLQVAIPQPTGHVNDFAGVLDSASIRHMEAVITDIRAKTRGEIAVVTLHPDGRETVREWRINPEMPIPEQATAVHGIKNEDVKDAPPFRELAPTLASIFAGADIGGYNARTFDVPFLEAEFERAGIAPSPLQGAAIVDPKEIFHAKEPRDLTAAVRFYCQETLVGAHGAKADAVATARVLRPRSQSASTRRRRSSE